MGTPIESHEVEADYVVSTHSHPDHFDFDAIPVLARNPNIHFVGATDCRPWERANKQFTWTKPDNHTLILNTALYLTRIKLELGIVNYRP